MDISVFGLGYVGVVSAACLAAEGHNVVGVDKVHTKIDLINCGRSPIIEAGVDRLIHSAHAQDRLRATTDVTKAIRSTDLSLVCVGTPSQANGNLDLEHVRNVCREIGTALLECDRYHLIAVRSTVLPGTMRQVVVPILEQTSGLRVGRNFGVCFNPEFLREGTAVDDFRNPPKTVIGEHDSHAGDRLLTLYQRLTAPVFRTTLEGAEMVKYVDNAWHAIKVDFANEIGSICKALGIDGFEVMNIFCHDTKLNLSSRYLRPGNSFGGSCLPKDMRALRYRARMLDLEIPLLSAVLPSNEMHLRRGIDLVKRQGKKKIGIMGLSFKSGTDDLRESPAVELTEYLLGKGYEILIYDKNVSLARLVGANRDYILNHIPHISQLLRDSVNEVLEHAEVIVIANASPELADIYDRIRPNQKIIDLVGAVQSRNPGAEYEGICW